MIVPAVWVPNDGVPLVRLREVPETLGNPNLREAWSEETARLGREHNDANVVSLGMRQYPERDALRFVEVFLSTPFSEGERHRRRIAMISDYERARTLP